MWESARSGTMNQKNSKFLLRGGMNSIKKLKRGGTCAKNFLERQGGTYPKNYHSGKKRNCRRSLKTEKVIGDEQVRIVSTNNSSRVLITLKNSKRLLTGEPTPKEWMQERCAWGRSARKKGFLRKCKRGLWTGN